MKDIIKKLKKIDSAFHINNIYPKYITKRVFQVAFLLIIGQLIHIAYVDKLDFKPHAYIECKNTLNCPNPFYYCQNETSIFIDYMFIDCEPYNKVNCVDGVCSKEVLEPKELLGKKPSELYKRFTLDITIFLFISFLINHLIYVWRSRR